MSRKYFYGRMLNVGDTVFDDDGLQGTVIMKTSKLLIEWFDGRRLRYPISGTFYVEPVKVLQMAKTPAVPTRPIIADNFRPAREPGIAKSMLSVLTQIRWAQINRNQ